MSLEEGDGKVAMAFQGKLTRGWKGGLGVSGEANQGCVEFSVLVWTLHPEVFSPI